MEAYYGNIVVLTLPKGCQDRPQATGVDLKLACWRHTMAMTLPRVCQDRPQATAVDLKLASWRHTIAIL